MRTPADLVARGEVIIRNNGATVTLEGGEVIAAGEVAVVARADRVAAVEILFGRFELEPNASHRASTLPPYRPWHARARGLELNNAGVNVDRGVARR